MEFTYNHARLRTKKVKKINGTVKETTEYILNGKNVVELIHTNHDTSEVNRLHFYYDAQGRVALVDFNGTLYSYAHNLQGDIIGILDTSGNLVVEYGYDAWGKPISVTGTLTTTLGTINPFRYRGYVWDQETGLYYPRSRYYNSKLIRFIITDTLLENNPFTYCLNNPVSFSDHNGKSKECKYGCPVGSDFPHWYYRIELENNPPDSHIHLYLYMHSKVIYEFSVRADGKPHEKSKPLSKQAKKVIDESKVLKKKWPPKDKDNSNSNSTGTPLSEPKQKGYNLIAEGDQVATLVSFGVYVPFAAGSEIVMGYSYTCILYDQTMLNTSSLPLIDFGFLADWLYNCFSTPIMQICYDY